MTLPQIALSTASALAISQPLTEGLTPDTARMSEALSEGAGVISAEALVFALTTRMPRPDAQARVSEMCAEAKAQSRSLEDVARATFDDLPETLFDSKAQLGEAPARARAFAAHVRSL